MPTKDSFCIILNPASGGGRARQRLTPILSLFKKHGLKTEVYETAYPRHAIQLTKSLIQDGAERIVSAGGDGTAFEVINGIMSSGQFQKITLGILPLGTGNSFMRDFQLHTSISSADTIIQGNTRKVDVGKVTIQSESNEQVYFFHNIIGLGFLAQACRLRNTKLKWFGHYGYHAAFFYLLPCLTAYNISLKIDGSEEIDINSPMLAVCNSQYTGHDMPISPLSNVTDGLFEIIYSESLTRMELLRIFNGLPSKKHIHHPKVKVVTGKSMFVQLEQVPYALVDGEVIEPLPFWIENLHNVLGIFAP